MVIDHKERSVGPQRGPSPRGHAAPPTEVAPRRTFLPEVQALRALAVLLVVAYHLRPDLVPGGYIGVDVFFVISGFLITGHMVREVSSTGRLRLGRFWANRARRILPASLVTMLAIIVTAMFLLPLSELRNVGRQAIASIFYVQNWILAADSVDYSASDNAATPFQHFWSLAVEEQFYLVWPLVVAAAATVALRRGRSEHALRTALLVAFTLVVVPSLLWSMAQVAAGDPAAYFATTTRLWELGVGGMLAVVLRYPPGLRLARSVLALTGLAAIGIAAWTLSPASPFPGANAIAPVLGTAAIIAAGRTSGPLSLTWLVDVPAVQWVGNVSYSLYLWHFPVAVYFTTLLNRPPSALEACVLFAVMLGLSWASYTWVERPFRSEAWARRSTPRVLVAALVAMLVVAAASSAFWIRPLAQDRAWDAAATTVQQADPERFGAGTARAGSYEPFLEGSTALTPNPIKAVQDEWDEAREGRCEPERADTLARMCELANPDGEVVLALVGDSHARALAPAVLQVAEDRGWRVISFLRDSCPFSMTPRTIPDGPTCVRSNEHVVDRLTDIRPDMVVTSFYSSAKFSREGGPEAKVEGLAQAWDKLRTTGAQVYAVEDNPRPQTYVIACLSENYRTPEECGESREKATRTLGLVGRAAELAPHVEVVDLTPLFCDRDTCPAVIGGVLVYRDTNHLSRTYATTLAPELAHALPSSP